MRERGRGRARLKEKNYQFLHFFAIRLCVCVYFFISRFWCCFFSFCSVFWLWSCVSHRIDSPSATTTMASASVRVQKKIEIIFFYFCCFNLTIYMFARYYYFFTLSFNSRTCKCIDYNIKKNEPKAKEYFVFNYVIILHRWSDKM